MLPSQTQDETASRSDYGLQKAEVVRVVDGDTLLVELDGDEERVRLVNIDTPESVSPDESKNTEYGKQASEHTARIVAPGQIVWLQREVSDRDRYGRLLRHVWLSEPADPGDWEEASGKTLEARIVHDGYARVVDYPPDTRYSQMLKELERDALARGAGLSDLWAEQ